MEVTKCNINSQLERLYESKWEKFATEQNKVLKDKSKLVKPTNPLLIRLENELQYQKADIKIMIVGQETNDWEGVFYNDLERISRVYQKFTSFEKFPGNSWFSNHINKLLKRIKSKYPQKSVKWVWNNIVKVGKAKDAGFPGELIHSIEKEHFKVFETEIEILKPNLVVFFTGKYDNVLNFHLPNNTRKAISDFPPNHIQLVEICNVDYSFRVRHPTDLHFMGKRVYGKYYDSIINTINF